MKVNKVTRKLRIKSLRPDPVDRIDVVFVDKDEATQHARWLVLSLNGARHQGEQ